MFLPIHLLIHYHIAKKPVPFAITTFWNPFFSRHSSTDVSAGVALWVSQFVSEVIFMS